MLAVLHLQHLHGVLAGQADIRTDTHFVQHQPGMLRRDFLVVHDQHTHIIRLDVMSRRALMPAVFQGDHHGKLRSFSLFGPDGDFPVHQLHDTPGNGHAQAGAAVFVVPAAVFLRERIKYFRDKCPFHADPRIADTEPHRGMITENSCPLHGQGHISRGIRKLDRI